MSNFGLLLILTLRQKIPIHLIQNIYEDYFESDVIYKKFLDILDKKESKKLNSRPLFNFIKIIFHKNEKNSTIIPYICKNHEIFRVYYIDHYVKIVKHFIKMDIDHSFAACIIMATYH